MKKILHFFRAEKFTNDFVNFIIENSCYEHTFWVYGENYLNYPLSYFKNENVKYFPRIEIKLNKNSTEQQLCMYDLIFYHGVFEKYIIDYFCLHQFLLKKLVLYFWGGDIPLLGGWKEKLKKKYIIKHAVAVITIILEDYESLKELYFPKGCYFNLQYYSDEQSDFMNKTIETGDLKKDSINIQIGNSATTTNDHIPILNMLEKFKKENIKIYVPLSYGDMNYAEQVIEHGKKIFGNKFIPLQQFMPLEKYYIFLKTIDIAIFNMCRQQALGNIFALLSTGCKVYLHPEGKLIDYLEKINFIVFRTNQIDNMSKEEFVMFSKEQRIYNKKMICEIFDKEKYIRNWEEAFEVLLNKVGD